MVIREVVDIDAIPNLLIEIITSMDPSMFAPHPQWLQEQLQLSDAILSEVIAGLAREVVREASQELIKFYIATERLAAKQGNPGAGGRVGAGASTDPLMVFTEEEVVNVVVEVEAEEVAREVVKGLAQDHLFNVSMASALEDMADGCVYEAASLAMIEMKQLHDFEMLCREVSDAMSREVAGEIVAQMVGEQEARLSVRANEELTKLSKSIVDLAVLRHLADRMSVHGESILERLHAEQRADRMLHSILLHQVSLNLSPKP
jgi:hypothetical protein